MSEITTNLIDKEQGAELGLDSAEWQRIVERLGRAPNRVEAQLFAYLWSEEIGFRNSSAMLKTIEQEWDSVKPLAGVFGGERTLAKGLNLVAKSVHNDKGFRLDPNNGLSSCIATATLSVAARGARPLGVSTSFFISELDKGDSLRRFQRSLLSVSDFLRQSGLTQLENNWYVNPLYQGNSMCGATVLGVREESSTPPTAKEGDSILLVGAPTYEAKIPRASDQETHSTPAPVADPFLTYRLSQCLVELQQNSLLCSASAISYGGLAVSCVRICEAISGTIEFDLNRITTKIPEPTAEKLLFSESFGRVLLCTPKNSLREVVKILTKWEIPHQSCGAVSATRGMEISYNHRTVADIPITFALSGATTKEFNVVKFPPMLKSSELASRSPAAPKKYRKKDDDEWSLIRQAAKSTKVENEDFPEPGSLSDVWIDLLANINLSSRKQVAQLFDNKLGGNSIVDSSTDGRSIRFLRQDGSYTLLGSASASCALYAGADPYLGMTHTVAYAMRKVAALGLTPVGLAFQLHYGNPEKYKEICDLSETIRALGDASRHWEIPILDGDISLGNGSDAFALLPTPVVTVFGTSASGQNLQFNSYPNEDDLIFMIGETASDDRCSEYSRYIHHTVTSSAVPNIDFDKERATAEFVSSLIQQGLLSACRTIGSGGLGVALSTATMSSDKPKGVELETNLTPSRSDTQLFSESPSRYLLFSSSENSEKLRAALKQAGIKIEAEGTVQGREFKLTGSLHCTMPVATAYRIWNQATERVIS